MTGKSARFVRDWTTDGFTWRTSIMHRAPWQLHRDIPVDHRRVVQVPCTSIIEVNG